LKKVAVFGAIFVFLLLIPIVIVAYFPGGCSLGPYEPAIAIKIHNQTDEELKIFIDGEVFLGRVFPGGDVVWEIERIHPHYKITAKDKDGNTIYIATLTGEDVVDKETYDVYFPPSRNNEEK